MKRHLSTIILLVVFLTGVSVLLYPSVSNYFNSRHQTRSVAAYREKAEQLSEKDTETFFRRAREYNKELEDHPAAFYSGEPRKKAYLDLEETTGEMMGYVTIKRLGIQLPIYYGTSESVLSAGAGHLEGSSIPIGGIGTHAVITGHRGLPSAKLFTDLDKLETGDVFTVAVLNEILTYEVDRISIVEPENGAELMIDPEQDYVTLITCTPYGINSHRLLIRGTRIEAANEAVRVTADAIRIDTWAAAPVVAVPLLCVLFIILLVSPGKKRRTRGESQREDVHKE